MVYSLSNLVLLASVSAPDGTVPWEWDWSHFRAFKYMCSKLKMECRILWVMAPCSSVHIHRPYGGSWVDFWRATRHCNPEECTLHSHRCEDVRSSNPALPVNMYFVLGHCLSLATHLLRRRFCWEITFLDYSTRIGGTPKKYCHV